MVLAASVALALGATSASADPLVLDAKQMDQVTAAGIIRDLSSQFSFTLGASLFDEIPGFGEDAVVTALLIDDVREAIDPDTGTVFTATIQSSSFGVRGFNTIFQRTGSFQTVFTMR
jgi:hypothetical protein